jgi:hypothetical protein
VLLSFVRLLEKIGEHDAALEGGEAPFVVVLEELRAGSIQHVLGFAPRHAKDDGAAAARKAGLEAARMAPTYLERRDVGPKSVRLRAKRLASALENLAALPTEVKCHLRGAVDVSLSDLAHAPPAPTVRAVESFRARILKAGGVSPRVQLKVAGHARPVTLEAPEPLAKLAGSTLYAEADVTAQIERTEDDRVLHGTLDELRILEAGDPVAAFDRWYEQAGKPWAKVKDIERGLGRGQR